MVPRACPPGPPGPTPGAAADLLAVTPERVRRALWRSFLRCGFTGELDDAVHAAMNVIAPVLEARDAEITRLRETRGRARTPASGKAPANSKAPARGKTAALAKTPARPRGRATRVESGVTAARRVATRRVATRRVAARQEPLFAGAESAG